MLAAGFIPVGRVNMTEFAFSGLGINPALRHACQPVGPRSGVSLAEFLGHRGGGGGRHGGGWVGHGYRRLLPHPRGVLRRRRLQAHRTPCSYIGVLPLAPSLDLGRILAPSVACCAAIDAILAAETPSLPAPIGLDGLRLAVPLNPVLDDMDQTVAAAFDRALSTLSAAGARISHVNFREFADWPPPI